MQNNIPAPVPRQIPHPNLNLQPPPTYSGSPLHLSTFKMKVLTPLGSSVLVAISLPSPSLPPTPASPPDPLLFTQVPPKYHDYLDVFSEE